MKSFVGNIVSADRTEKEISVRCPDGIDGAMMGKSVLIIPIDGNKTQTEWGHLRDRMSCYNENSLQFEDWT